MFNSEWSYLSTPPYALTSYPERTLPPKFSAEPQVRRAARKER